MNSNYQQRIGRQFCSFCIKVLKNEARNIHKEYSRIKAHEKSLQNLTNKEIEQLSVEDEYLKNNHKFLVADEHVNISDDTLANALDKLPQDKRDIILLSYFLELSDSEIGRRKNTHRQTISYRRTTTLKELRNILEKEGFEWPEHN